MFRILASWLGTNWGSVLSLLGLILTLSARDFARKAKTSADAAREAAEQTEKALSTQSLIHAVGESRRLASELNTLLSSNLHAASLIRSQDLAGSLRFLTVRWGQHIGGSASEMAEAVLLVDSIITKLHIASSRPLSSAESKRLVLLNQKTLNIIIAAQASSEESGVRDAQ